MEILEYVAKVVETWVEQAYRQAALHKKGTYRHHGDGSGVKEHRPVHLDGSFLMMQMEKLADELLLQSMLSSLLGFMPELGQLLNDPFLGMGLALVCMGVCQVESSS